MSRSQDGESKGKRSDRGGGKLEIGQREDFVHWLDYTKLTLSRALPEYGDAVTRLKRAQQQQTGVAVHPEYRWMTGLQLERFIKDAQGTVYVLENKIRGLESEIKRIEKLLKK